MMWLFDEWQSLELKMGVEPWLQVYVMTATEYV